VITEQATAIGVGDCRLIDLPKIPDVRGNLTFVEGGAHIPFGIARVFWIYDVPGGEKRGAHAYRTQDEVLIALSGSFDVVVDAGDGPGRVQLNRAHAGLYVPHLTWRHLENFATNAVCLVLASSVYDADDYIRDHAEFLKLRKPS
jgi:hypothetical protein